MSKSNSFETSLLQYIFNSTAISGLGTTLYVALHTADPGEAGNASTNEVSYTEYARVALTRADGTAFTVSGNSVSPAATISFPQSSASGGTATYFSITTAATGTSPILYSGTITPSIPISNGTIPELGTGTAITED